MTSGRMPVGATEVMVNKSGAQEFGLAVGDHVDISLMDVSNGSFDAEKERLEVVGIGLLTDEVIEDELARKGLLLAPRAFTERHLDRAVWGKTRVDLRPGADPGPIVGALAGKGLFVDELLSEDRRRVQDALRPLLVTLAGFAALAATATVVVVGQSLSRLLRRRRADDRSLAAMGCTTAQLVATDLLYSVMLAGAAMALAVAAAVAASPLFPVGPVRKTGVVRGVDADLVVLAGGGVGLALAVVALVGLGSWRRRTATGRVSPGRVPAILAARPAAATGLRLCTAQRGLAVTLAGIAAGLAVLVATITFTGSLGRLTGDPALVGFSWDLGGRTAFDSVDLGQVRRLTEDDSTVRRVTGLEYLSGEANGKAVNLAIFDAVKGSPWPPLAAGRLPAAKDEVLVGRATLDDLGLGLGEAITLAIPIDVNVSNPDAPPNPTTVSRTYRIVGSAVAPAIGIAGTDTPKLASGVLLASEALDVPASALSSDIVLFDLADSSGAGAIRARFPEGLPVTFGTTTEWFTTAAPSEVSQAGEARTIIWLSLAALAVAIVGAVVHTLLGSVRQRRREYAVLKALGFTRGQVRTTVLSQSGALLGLALVVAVPVGIAAGRWLWTGFAEDLGIVSNPAVPLLLLGGSVLATVGLVQGAALVPASVARRTPLAQTLRSE